MKHRSPAVVSIVPGPDGDPTADIREKTASLTGAATIDLSRLSYIPASGLTELIRLRKRLPDADIVLCDPTPLVRRTLDIVGFLAVFAVERSSGAA